MSVYHLRFDERPVLGKIFTFGYLQPGAMGVVQRLIVSGAVLIDIRFSPVSCRPEWSKKRLSEQFGSSYQYVHALGNIHYRSRELPIELVNGSAGISLVGAWLEKGYDVCLLCACLDGVVCHRSKAAALVQAAYSCEVVHL